MKKSFFAALAAVCAISMSLPLSIDAKGKTWSLEDRQEQLMKDINEGQKNKGLTVKEANSLRKDLSNVSRKKVKFRKENKGSRLLTEDNKASLEKDLNDISVQVKKLELEKRAQ